MNTLACILVLAAAAWPLALSAQEDRTQRDVATSTEAPAQMRGRVSGIATPHGAAGAALEIEPTDEAAVLASALAGPGVTILDATLITGEVVAQGLFPFTVGLSTEDTTFAAGVFQNGPLGLTTGVLLTSGEVTLAAPPNVSLDPYDEGATGVHDGLNGIRDDLFCDAVIQQFSSGIQSLDVTRLIVHFALDDHPDVDGISIDYLFGSEEYPFYVGSQFSDAFGIFVGPFDEPLPPNATDIVPDLIEGGFYYNIGRDQQGQPITINGPFFSGDRVVKTFPDALDPPSPFDPNLSQYNGLTPRLSSSLRLPTGPEHEHALHVVICDAGDAHLDSGLFLGPLRACLDDCGGTGFCGDGVIQTGEECDDGNNVDDDECSNACRINPGFEQPAIALEKLLVGGEPYTTVGDVLDFAFLIRNTGNVILAEVVVDDPDTGTPTCTPAQPAELFPDAQMNCTASYTARPEDMARRSYTNIAVASGVARDGLLADAEDSATVLGGCEFVGCEVFADGYED